MHHNYILQRWPPPFSAGAQAVAKIGSAIVKTVSSTNETASSEENSSINTSEKQAPLALVHSRSQLAARLFMQTLIRVAPMPALHLCLDTLTDRKGACYGIWARLRGEVLARPSVDITLVDRVSHRQSTRFFEPGQTLQTGTAACPRKMSTNGRCRFFLRTRSTVSPSSTAASRLRNHSIATPPQLLAYNHCAALCSCGRPLNDSCVAPGATQRPEASGANRSPSACYAAHDLTRWNTRGWTWASWTKLSS